jgi:hypothetical protein
MRDAAEVHDPFCGPEEQKDLSKWPATEAHRWRREVTVLDLVGG